MEVIHSRCVGIDVSRRNAKVRIRVAGLGRKTVETARTWAAITTNAILALREHLMAEQLSLVVMEATGDYWKPFYYLLEDHLADHLALTLVNAREAKTVPGRKTDVADAEWLADLGAHGLVRASLVPPPPIRELRDLTRTRANIARDRAPRDVADAERLTDLGAHGLHPVAVAN